MRIKDLFTVPEGEKVTEQVFHRVLISSICSILLCMTCLAGTTWAWFTVSIENTGNVIEIASAWEEPTEPQEEATTDPDEEPSETTTEFDEEATTELQEEAVEETTAPETEPGADG